jgi:DNA repair protein RadA/Sms
MSPRKGNIAGPRVLEHMVDAVLQLEGERFHAFRLLRSVKNRFGSTNEVGVFEMSEQGMEEVRNPSELFLAERLPNATGSAIAVSMEGTRPLLVEVQALCSTTAFSMPRRTANGVDANRLLLLTAVLSKRVGMDLSDQDIFVNVVGGMRIDEPAADLAVAVRHRQQLSATARVGRPGDHGRGGAERRTAQRRPACPAAARGGQARLHARARPAQHGAAQRRRQPARRGIEVNRRAHSTRRWNSRSACWPPRHRP